MRVNILTKQQATKRLEYVQSLNYTDKEYMRNMRKHMLKYRQNANGLLNQNFSAERELEMFKSYGFKNMKDYTIDILEQNIEYCNVLECESHDEQINKTIEYLNNCNNRDYLIRLKPFSRKNEKTWFIPADRLVNWIDSFMIQREVFFNYSTNEKEYLSAIGYFKNNVLFMTVETDNDEENYDTDINQIMNVFDELVNGIIDILRDMPEDRNIENLFTISDEKINSNIEEVQKLSMDYIEFIKKELD